MKPPAELRAPRQVVVASANPDKAKEIAATFVVPWIELVPRPADIPDIDETGSTLEENALLKATTIALATGMPAIADDTGLEVAALGGAPGIYAARYAGEDATYQDNVNKLLKELDGEENRQALFATVAVYVSPSGSQFVCRGELPGTIATEPHGENGFGYDPIFVPTDSDGRTYAQMTTDEKSKISHRAKAFQLLAAKLTLELVD